MSDPLSAAAFHYTQAKNLVDGATDESSDDEVLRSDQAFELLDDVGGGGTLSARRIQARMSRRRRQAGMDDQSTMEAELEQRIIILQQRLLQCKNADDKAEASFLLDKKQAELRALRGEKSAFQIMYEQSLIEPGTRPTDEAQGDGRPINGLKATPTERTHVADSKKDSDPKDLSVLKATMNNGPTAIRMAVKKGAYIDAQNERGLSAIHVAAYRDYDACMSVLLELGSDPSLPSTNGRSPAFLAAQRGSERCLQLLLDAGANVNASDSSGLTPVAISVMQGHAGCLKIFIDSGRVGANTVVETMVDDGEGGADDEGRSSPAGGKVVHATLASVAAECGRADCLRFLLSRGGHMRFRQEHSGVSEEVTIHDPLSRVTDPECRRILQQHGKQGESAASESVFDSGTAGPWSPAMPPGLDTVAATSTTFGNESLSDALERDNAASAIQSAFRSSRSHRVGNSARHILKTTEADVELDLQAQQVAKSGVVKLRLQKESEEAVKKALVNVFSQEEEDVLDDPYFQKHVSKQKLASLLSERERILSARRDKDALEQAQRDRQRAEEALQSVRRKAEIEAWEKRKAVDDDLSSRAQKIEDMRKQQVKKGEFGLCSQPVSCLVMFSSFYYLPPHPFPAIRVQSFSAD